MHDIVIIGAGPAGLSAAITARARNKEVLVLSNSIDESPLAKAALVDNYPGTPQISGRELIKKMYDQAAALGAQHVVGRAISVLPLETGFSVTTSDEIYEARCVILAPGIPQAKPLIGEEEFLGRGVSYCATCDGMLYRNATVCVLGLNSEAVEEANFLKEIGAEVTFLAKKAPEGLVEGINVICGTALEVKGDMLGVTGLVYQAGDTKGNESLDCNGVFILRAVIAPENLMVGLELSEGQVVVDAQMRTNISGVFAAGDCTGAPLQIAKAVGEGQRACFSAVAYLDN